MEIMTIQLGFLPYFPYFFAIQLTFLPYFPYHFTIQLSFLPYVLNHFIIQLNLKNMKETQVEKRKNIENTEEK
jgi:hypothetical protein